MILIGFLFKSDRFAVSFWKQQTQNSLESKGTLCGMELLKQYTRRNLWSVDSLPAFIVSNGLRIRFD